MNNETSEGFGNVTDVQNLTGLNQAALQNGTGNQSAAGGQQQQNQTSNQSAAGGQQQQNQTSNQSAAGGQQQGNQSAGNQTGNQSGSVLEQLGKMFSGG
jgi:hypothetical protein